MSELVSQYNNDKSVLKRCEEIANERYDGHFTLLKFTHNWRFCFGTIAEGNCSLNEITNRMAVGKSMVEAINAGIAGDVNIYTILESTED